MTDIGRLTGLDLSEPDVVDFGCRFGRMSLPLAKRCRHVYGLDVSIDELEEADRHAKEVGISNVEWLEPDRLAELHGRYDLAISFGVFQHIPVRRGEQTFAQLVQGPRPGGSGAIQIVLRPPRPRARLFESRRGLASYAYPLLHSYSRNRLGILLGEAGVTRWHVRWHEGSQDGPRPGFPSATLIFEKPMSTNGREPAQCTAASNTDHCG